MEFNKYISGTTLNISTVKLTLKDIQHLVRFLQKNSYIIQLNLFKNNIGDEGAKALAKLTNLTFLNLRFDNIGDEGAKALAKLTNLTSLDLEFNYIGVEGAKALAKLTNLTSLDLEFNYIGVEGAKALAKLTNLTSLDLRSNKIGDEGAKALAKLTNLTFLNLGFNYIGVEGAKALAKLTNLTFLNLGSNNIGDEGAKALAKLTNLTFLNLGSNDIGDEGAKALAKLTNLTSLDLEFNYIGVEGAKALAKLTNLTFLNLGSNNIGDEGAKALAKLTNLTFLNLGSNNIGDEGAKALAKLTNLTSLDLKSNNIGDEGAKALAKLTNLTFLNLGSNNIGDEGAKALAKLTNLTSLDLKSNNIGDEGAKALAKLTNLTFLNLGSNNIGDEGAKALAKLTNLTSLNLRSNKIGDEGAKALAKLTNLTSLNLRSNKIGVEGAKALAKLTNLTSLDLIDNEITLKQKEELIEALVALKLDELNQSENSALFGDTMLREFYNYLKGLPSKTDEELYRNGVKEMIFTLARHDYNRTTIKHILTYSNKYPFLINSRNKDGHKLFHFYTYSPDMQKFLFEHGLIPELEKKDGRLQRIIEDNQSVHNSSAVKKTNFIVKELVESIAANKDELKQEADFYLADIPKLLQQYKDDQIRIKLLSITEDEKRSVMEKTLQEGNPVPNDQQFVEAVMSKAKETLKTQYLRKKATGEYDEGYPTAPMQYDYTKDDAKVTIPQSIGYIKLLIDGFDIPLNERKELLVTLAEQNPKLIEQKLSNIKSELENDDITQEQVTKRSEFHKLLNDTEDKNKIDKLFKEISDLDLKEIWKKQKRFVLAKQIYVAATTYGENSSACIQGTWSQIVNSISEIDLGLADKYEQYLAKERKKEKQREVITAKNIGAFEEYLGNQLIQYAKDHPELKEPLLDFALVMVDVEKSEEIMLEQQQILAKINQEFSSKIKEYLPNYGRDIPTLQEYKIIIDEIADVSGQKIQQFIDDKKEQIKLMIDNPINQERVENDTVNKEENLEQHIHPQNTNVVTDKSQAEIKITNSAIKSPVVDNNTRGQTLVSSVKIVNSNKSQQISPTKKAIYTTMTVSPFIAVGIYSAVALSMAGVVFNPVVAAGIFIGMSFLSAVCFAIVKISEKVSEEKAKNSDTGTLTALGNVLAPECLKSDNFLKQS